MIIKPWEASEPSEHPAIRAGAEAERQMAFYLHRALSENTHLLVLNNLRLIDPRQPEHDGRDGVCQIDHLVLHSRGAFIVESKSVTGEISVAADGSGGEEWVRHSQDRRQGMPSPIQQGRRQGEFLRAYLQRHREELLGKVMVGARLIARFIAGTDQRSFRNFPIQIIVAISDQGSIRRVKGWQEPSEPFQTFLCKADLASEKISTEFERHRKAAGFMAQSRNPGSYGLWSMTPAELLAVANFLHASHVPRSGAGAARGTAAKPRAAQIHPSRSEMLGSSEGGPVETPAAGPVLTGGGPMLRNDPALVACRSCGGRALVARWGQFGYYWKCGHCNGNTPMELLINPVGQASRLLKRVRNVTSSPNPAHCSEVPHVG